MTQHHDHLAITLTAPHLMRLPDEDSSLRLTADMRLSASEVTLYAWHEQDVHWTLDRLENHTGVTIGDDAYIDLLFHGDREIQLLLWRYSHAHPLHVINVSETVFFGAVADARSEANRCWGQVEPGARPRSQNA